MILLGGGGETSSGGTDLVPRRDNLGRGYYSINKGRVQRQRGIGAVVREAGSAADFITIGAEMERGRGRRVL